MGNEYIIIYKDKIAGLMFEKISHDDLIQRLDEIKVLDNKEYLYHCEVYEFIEAFALLI